MISQITRSKVIKCVRGLPVLDLLRRCLDRGPASSFCISAVAAAPANAPTAMSETISSRSQPYSSPVILLSPHSRPYANLGSMPSGRPLPIWAGPEPACMRAVGNTRSAILGRHRDASGLGLSRSGIPSERTACNITRCNLHIVPLPMPTPPADP